MEKIFTSVIIENYAELLDVQRGLRSLDAVRRVMVDNAVVDTNELTLCLSVELIDQLGLMPSGQRGSMTFFGPVRLTIQGRDCHVDVTAISGQSIVVGHVPLTYLDLVIDERRCELIGNPAHGGEQILECY